MPLHHQSKEKEIQKKRNIKSRKIDKRKRKSLVLICIITAIISGTTEQIPIIKVTLKSTYQIVSSNILHII